MRREKGRKRRRKEREKERNPRLIQRGEKERKEKGGNV